MKYAIDPRLSVRETPSLRAQALVAITGKPHIYRHTGRLLVSGKDAVTPARFKAAIRYVIRVS